MELMESLVAPLFARGGSLRRRNSLCVPLAVLSASPGAVCVRAAPGLAACYTARSACIACNAGWSRSVVPLVVPLSRGG